MRTVKSFMLALLVVLVGFGLAGAAIAATLTVTKAGSGDGMVTSSVGVINCGSTCIDTYAIGTSITLTANPDKGKQFTGWLGPCTGIGTCQFQISGPTTVTATFARTIIGAHKLDIDGTSCCNPLTDGLLLIRHLFGLSGASLTNGAIGSGATRTTSTQISTHIVDIRPTLDIDGNGQVDAPTDGLLLLRYLFGLRGTSLVAGAVGASATRITAADIEKQIKDSLLTSPVEKLRQFGFGQAVLIDIVAPPARADIALTIPGISHLATAQDNFRFHAAASETSIGYLTPPLTVSPVSTAGCCGYSIGNFNEYLQAADPSGSSNLTTADLDAKFQNNMAFNFLRLDLTTTRSKLLALLNQIILEIPSTNGFFIDHVEPNANPPNVIPRVQFTYPADLHSLISTFKQGAVGAGKIIGGNFFSLRQHRANGYSAFNNQVFDVVLVEDYNGVSSADRMADVIDFYLQFQTQTPPPIIVINAQVAPTACDDPKGHEAVTLAALVGGLHAIDGGSSAHGDNTFARTCLNFPVLRAGKPTAATLVGTDPVYRRDYANMIAIYAKQSGAVLLPAGTWIDYWTTQAIASGSLSVQAGKSYLLFKQ